MVIEKIRKQSSKAAISVMSAQQIIEYLQDFFDHGDDPDFALRRLKHLLPKEPWQDRKGARTRDG